MDHALTPAEAVRFGILGPFQVSVAGNVVSLDQPKPRAVLAMLVLSPNAVVSPGRLIDDLWEHHPPASAANTLQTYVHRLRSLLPPDTLITRAGGYELVIDPACVDAVEFERRAESPAARAPNARLRAHALGAALALWRGEALEDLSDAVWALPEVARLEAARLDALERRIEADLELGQAREVLRELEGLVQQHPFRERFSALLMLALYREGRQAEALRAFERLRRSLGDEMGIEPSAQLTRLERQILLQDTRLDLQARADQIAVPLSARLAATSSSPFVGRPRELEVIDRAFDDTVAGLRSTVLISGEPGIGKSALAASFARGAVERGAVVLYGHSDTDLAIPFQPWSEALAPLVAHAPPELLDEHLSVHGTVLARLVPELVERATGELPTRDDIGPQRLFGAVADLLERVGAVSPVVIVLDDLHWADRATTELLQFLVALDRAIRVMFVATLRDSEIDSKHALSGVLAAFVRLPAVYRAPLTGLDDEELLELVNVTARSPDARRSVALRDALMHETDGNPFFAIEILRHWHDAGAVGETSSLRVHGVPIGVRDVIDDRVARLGDEAEQLLAIAAVIGRDFDLELLGGVTGLNGDVLTALCERSVDASVLVRTDRPWSYSFAHALIEHSIYDALAPTPRAGLHLRIVRALEALHHDDLLPYAGALAHHWMSASVRESAEQALKYATWAGDHAMSMLAPSDAVGWYRQALDLLEGHARVDDRARCALLVALGRAQAVGGDFEARATLIGAGALARRLGATELLTAAALATRRGDFNQAAGEDAELTALTRAALDAVGDSVTPERVRLLAALMEHTAGRDWELARERAVEAVDAARRLGDEQLLMEAITTTYVARAQPETLPQRLADTHLAVSIADERRSPLDRFATRFTRYVAVMESGEVGEADRLLDEMEHIATAAALTLPHTQFQLLMTRAGRRILAGDHAGAAQAADALFALNSANVPEAMTTGGALLSLIGYEQGRVAEMIDGFAAAAEQNPDFAVLRAAVANYYSDLGRLDEAGAMLAAERASEFRAIPYDINWTTSMTLYGDCAVALGDRSAAATIRDRLAPFSSSTTFNGLTSSGALSRVLGRLDTLLGSYDDADRELRRALDLNSAMGAPFWVARTQLDYADLLVLQPADDRRAFALAGEAEATAVLFGFGGLERRAGELLAQLASVGGAG